MKIVFILLSCLMAKENSDWYERYQKDHVKVYVAQCDLAVKVLPGGDEKLQVDKNSKPIILLKGSVVKSKYLFDWKDVDDKLETDLHRWIFVPYLRGWVWMGRKNLILQSQTHRTCSNLKKGGLTPSTTPKTPPKSCHFGGSLCHRGGLPLFYYSKCHSEQMEQDSAYRLLELKTVSAKFCSCLYTRYYQIKQLLRLRLLRLRLINMICLIEKDMFDKKDRIIRSSCIVVVEEKNEKNEQRQN